MKRADAAVFVLGFLGCFELAHAQAALNGKWHASFEDSKGDSGATLVLSDSGGTWRHDRTGQESKRNPCVGREFPATVSTRHKDEIVISIDEATTVPGCHDTRLIVKPTDPNTLEGTFKGGKPVKLVRQ